MYVYICVDLYICLYVCIDTYACMYMYIHIYIYICICICIHTCIHTHTHSKLTFETFNLFLSIHANCDDDWAPRKFSKVS